MSRTATILFAGLICGTPASAEDYAVSKSIELMGSPEEIWQVIGDFCDLDDWHPGIVACALTGRDGGVHRKLKLDNGAEVLEKLIAADPGGLNYTYSIVEAPLPIENYTATLAITRGSPAILTWSGKFTSDDPSMEAVFSGLYESGLDAIKAKIGN